ARCFCGASERLPLRQRANARIHLVLGHINTDDNNLILCHHPLPSLLGSGSKPVQLFGLRKTTGSVPRSPTGSRPLSTNGIRSSDGRWVRAARSHILADFADTRARSKPLKPLRRECRVIPVDLYARVRFL